MKGPSQPAWAGLALLGLTAIVHATTYEVGDGKPYASIGAVPWESLAAGDTVLIHHRATPYKEKWVICRQGWKVSHSNPGALVNQVAGNVVGTSPLFRDFAAQDFSLATNSTCVNAGGALPAGLAGNPLVSEYAKHRASRPRKVDQALDIGALECGFDSDGDGMPDWWEWSFKSNITAMTGTSDSDGDGVLDRNEYIAGTCPTNPASVFRIDPAGVAGTNLTIRWPSATNRLYAVEYTTNLVGTAFGVISNSIPATPPTNSVVGALQGTSGFFRVKAQVEMGE